MYLKEARHKIKAVLAVCEAGAVWKVRIALDVLVPEVQKRLDIEVASTCNILHFLCIAQENLALNISSSPS